MIIRDGITTREQSRCAPSLRY